MSIIRSNFSLTLSNTYATSPAIYSIEEWFGLFSFSLFAISIAFSDISIPRALLNPCSVRYTVFLPLPQPRSKALPLFKSGYLSKNFLNDDDGLKVFEEGKAFLELYSFSHKSFRYSRES